MKEEEDDIKMFDMRRASQNDTLLSIRWDGMEAVAEMHKHKHRENVLVLESQNELTHRNTV